MSQGIGKQFATSGGVCGVIDNTPKVAKSIAFRSHRETLANYLDRAVRGG